MSFTAGFRRQRSAGTTKTQRVADAAKTWAEKLEPMYLADHPRYLNRYDVYLSYVAFLTAGTVEHHWSEGVKPDGRIPFIPLGRTEDFLPDLHKKMRAFRESRHIDGPASAELVRHSYELLGFLEERIPRDNLNRFLATARTYIFQNEAECLSRG